MKFKAQNKPESLIFYILILVIIPALLYFKVVNFGLSGLDDSSIIYNINNTSGSKINIIGALTHDALMGNKGDTFYRPMQVISLMIDAGISGTQPWIYHFSNLLLHILTVIALFSFLCNIGIKKNISFLISLLFSVNPMISNAVAWIPARGDLLLCLFSLLSFITFLEYSKKKNPVYICLHFVAFLLALLSKETAVLLPFLIITYLILVQQKKITVNEIKPFLSVWLISYVLFFALRYIVLKISHPSNELGFIPLFKNLPVIPITFGKFFIPSNLTTLPFFDNTALITGVIVFLVILGSAIKFAWPKKHLLLWGAIWFLAFSIPPMLFRTYFAEIGYEYFDYRIYLPSVGILIMTGII